MLSESDTSFQKRFHQRWSHLNDPHVRTLAWLLDAPDLLDPLAPQWGGRIAALGVDAGARAADWLAMLDAAPGSLHAHLHVQPHSRLGRYAEQLMGFYFLKQGVLRGQGIQVRTEQGKTIGEFDFLLQDGAQLAHWEFATKFYLLQSRQVALDSRHQADYFVGPNLADTLGAKMRKILDRQLSLADHPAAQQHLPQPVAMAQALVKGWLFYPDKLPPAQSLGLSVNHCRGFWCTLSEMDDRPAERYLVLPRLSWLAPAKTSLAQSVDWQVLKRALTAGFQHDTMPVLVAFLQQQTGGQWLETSRGFIVPEDWRSRAGERAKKMVEPAICAGTVAA